MKCVTFSSKKLYFEIFDDTQDFSQEISTSKSTENYSAQLYGDPADFSWNEGCTSEGQEGQKTTVDEPIIKENSESVSDKLQKILMDQKVESAIIKTDENSIEKESESLIVKKVELFIEKQISINFDECNQKND